MAKNDDKIKQLLTKVEEQQTALGSKPKGPWQTNALFKYADGASLNLNAVRDSQVLVEALAILLEKESLQSQAAERLGVPARTFIWNGYTVEDWEADFKKRIGILKWEEKEAQLKETKKKLNSLVSEEAKTELELANIENFLT